MAREKNKASRPAEPSAAGEPEPDDVKYGAAVDEIEQILASIDRDEIDLDELGTKVERAVDLLKICRAKLKATEARVTEVLKDLAAEEAEEAEAAESDSEDSEAGETTAPDTDAAPDESSGTSRKKGRARKDDDELPF